MPIQTISTGGTTATNLVVAKFPVNLRHVEGYYAGTTSPMYLQMHEATALPGNGAVPLKPGQYLSPQSSFWYDYPEEVVKFGTGLVLALSTTEGTLTIATVGGDKMDVAADIERQELPLTTGQAVTTVGDLTTGVGTGVLAVWISGNHGLVRVESQNSDAANAWLQFFTYAAPAVAAVPVLAIKVPASTTNTQTNSFGNGFQPMQQLVLNTVTTKMYIAFSSTQNTYTALAGNTMKCRAKYV